VTWVMFDYGGVVSHPPTQQDLALLAGVAGVGVPAFSDVYWECSYREAEVAELARLDCASWLRLQAGTVALIEDLAAAGRPLALLSNAPDQLADAIRALPIAAHFGQLIFSCQLKLAKPDPRCYSDALVRLGASADEVIFIDDRTENVAAAAALGLRSVHFTSPEGMRSAVTERLASRG